MSNHDNKKIIPTTKLRNFYGLLRILSTKTQKEMKGLPNIYQRELIQNSMVNVNYVNGKLGLFKTVEYVYLNGELNANR